jgi:hypothetical protein
VVRGGATLRRFGRGLPRAAALALAVASGCEVHGLVGSDLAATGGGSGGFGSGSGGADGDETGGPTTAITEPGESSSADGDETSGVRFDVPPPDAPESCDAPYALPCDGASNDPLNALGLNCDGGPTVTGTFRGHETAMTVHEGKLGSSSAYPPREGSKFVILSTGVATDLALSPAELQAADPSCVPLACPSTQHSSEVLALLPEPIDVRQVSKEGVDCVEDKTLVGTGDCSNTLFEQYVAGSGALDYAELRIDTVVPSGVDGLAYDFAFFSVEYPTRMEHESPFNDMYVAWLESENWTGNVSFDEFGHPISATGVFLDYKDSPSAACPEPCNAPELHGFAMEGHAATKWLETTAPVVEGEVISLLFAIFDLTDGSYDSMVALDHFEWTCSDAPPFTRPVG